MREPYQSQRVLRQMGHVQAISLPPFQAKADSVRGIDSRTYLIDYEASAQVWKYWLDAQLALELRGSNVVHPWDCVDGYVDCFSKITHKPTSQNCTPRCSS
eukprot:TRINITY_DN6166_c0_g2_i3.p1 TRINITY_DN6166_c0_g2~~TRINITY_DN6166_c0_g2_i3.p1  ORF type:complete len:101 (+),score=1.97 TRINITY_DN6166_c0_g2_i3:252-554(+)